VAIAVDRHEHALMPPGWRVGRVCVQHVETARLLPRASWSGNPGVGTARRSPMIPDQENRLGVPRIPITISSSTIVNPVNRRSWMRPFEPHPGSLQLLQTGSGSHSAAVFRVVGVWQPLAISSPSGSTKSPNYY